MCCFISHPSILLFYCSHKKKIIIKLVSFNSVFVLVWCLLCPINKCATFNSLKELYKIWYLHIQYKIFYFFNSLKQIHNKFINRCSEISHPVFFWGGSHGQALAASTNISWHKLFSSPWKFTAIMIYLPID